MAFRFLQIGKANNEIERLEKDNAALVAQNAELTSNTPAALQAAEAAVLEANTKRADAEAAMHKMSAELTKAGEDLKVANATISEFTLQLAAKDAEVTAKASAEAAKIVAGVGSPPPPAVPKTETNRPAAKGIDLILATTKADMEACGFTPRK